MFQNCHNRITNNRQLNSNPQTSVRPKPGFSIGNRNPGHILVLVLVLEPKLFYPKQKLIYLFIYLCLKILKSYHVFRGIYIFLKLKLDTDLQKELKSLIFGSKFGFRGLVMIKKYPIHIIGN